MKDYLIRIAAWLSQGVNCIFLFGSPDQTVSARAYVQRDNVAWGVVYLTLNIIFFWQSDHCFESHLADRQFAKEVLRDR